MEDKKKAYWKENLRFLGILLSIWFAVSFGAGILFKDVLDQFHFGGFKLGFWFAQQGSIYVFVIFKREIKIATALRDIEDQCLILTNSIILEEVK